MCSTVARPPSRPRLSRPLPEATATRSDRLWATTIIVLWGALVLLADAFPWGRLWAINHLAFLPPFATYLFTALLAFALLAIWLVPEPESNPTSAAARSTLRWVPIILLAWIALMIVFRAATPLLGDGFLRIDEAQRRAPGLLLLTDLLPGLITTSFQQNVGTVIGLTPRSTIAGFSILCGLLFAAGSAWLWPRAFATADKRQVSDTTSSPTVLWLFSSGVVMIFAGYFETYALAAACLALFALAVVAHVNGRLGWGWVVGLWGLSYWSHLLAIGWAPALIWAVARGATDRRQQITRAVVALLTVTGSILLIALLRTEGTPFLWHRYLLPLWSGYSVIDPRHLVDLLNHLLLLVPVLFLLLLPGATSTAIRWPQASIWLVLPSLGFCLFFAADLGWARDWDLYALASMPAIVATTIYFARVQVTWSRARRIAAATVAITSMMLWMWVNHDANASVHRFQYLLQLDNRLGSAGNETLARYWREAGRWDSVVEELGRGLAKEPHARLAVQRGYAWGMLGNYDSALVDFRHAIDYDPGLMEGYLGAGQALNLKGQPDSAEHYLEQALALDPTRTDVRYQLAMSFISQGNFGRALPHIARAAARNPNQPDIVNAWGTTLAETGALDSAATVLVSLLARQPNFELAYASLAWVQWRRGDTAAADSVLRLYERKVAVAERVGPAVSLRHSLDSMATGH